MALGDAAPHATEGDSIHDLLIVHGCCKAENPERNSRRKIEAENAESAQWLEGSFGALYTAYYTCTLNQEVRRLGHRLRGEAFPLPEDCEAPPAVPEPVGHDEFASWLLGLEQGMTLLAGQGADIPSGQEQDRAEAGWADVYTYLHAHEQGALGPDVPFRRPVWEAVAVDIPPRPYVVVAHSLGSLIAADMVREGLLRPAALVTIGSPLGVPLVHQWVEAFTFDGPWLNLYDPRDAAAAFGILSPFDHAGFAGTPSAHVRVDGPPDRGQHDLHGYLQSSAERLRHLLDTGRMPPD